MSFVKQHTRYEVLDGMRGIAALSVMIYHYTCPGGPVFKSAYIAVDVFFILSGFVIAHSYGHRMLSGRMSFSEFVTRRIIRLYPMLFAGLVVGTLYFCMAGSIESENYLPKEIATSLLCNLFFLPYFSYIGIQRIFPVDNALWSLFFELFANLSCLFLFRMENRTLQKIIIIMYGLIVIQGTFKELAHHRAGIDINSGWSTDSFIGGFPRVFYGFVFGILLYRLTKEHNSKTQTLLSRLKPLNSFACYAVLMMVILFPLKVYGLYSLFILTLIAPLLVFLGSAMTCRNPLTLYASQFFGWISYPLYCLHMPVGQAMAFIFYHYNISHRGITLVAVSSLATLALSIALTKLYEEPVRHYLSKRLKAGLLGKRTILANP